MRWTVGCVSLALALFLSACSGLGEAGRELRDAAQLRSDVAKVAGTDVVVSIADGKRLELRLVDSPWKRLPDAEKDQRASEIAHYAFADYPESGKLESISVIFVRRGSFLSVDYLTDKNDAHEFTADALRSSHAKPASDGA
jgi:hypothetical protein